MSDFTSVLRALDQARVARVQIIRGNYGWIALDCPPEEAVGMTAAMLDTDAGEVAAALEEGADEPWL